MKSEFKRVAEARKSRHSNGAFCTLDVEMTGNTAQYQHLLNKHSNTKGDLAYMVNLRSYKPTSKFKPEKPYLFPSPRSFSPEDQYKQLKEDCNSKLAPNQSNWCIKPKTKPNSPMKKKKV